MKKRSKADVVNYRPATLLCIVSKVLERLLYGSIVNFFKGLITDPQYGFRERRSAIRQMITCLDKIYKFCSAKIEKIAHFSLTFPKLSTKLIMEYSYARSIALE